MKKIKENATRIGIITFHRAYNYGAVLQAYALQERIRRFGISCDVIDYWSEIKRGEKRLFRVAPKAGVKSNLQKFFKDIYRTGKYRNFDQFMKKTCMLSERSYSSLEELREMEEESLYDTYIVGSDQVWNAECNLKDEVYLLTFAENNYKKCAYAASFGGEKADSGMEQEFRGELKRFRVISVREKGALEQFPFLKEYGATEVLDPTFLLSKEDYLKISSKRIVKNKYAFLYTVPKDNKLGEHARAFCKKNGIVLIDCKKSYTFFINSKPEDFLSFFAYAEYIFTNSFHGTAFSIIMKKRFSTEINIYGGNINNRAKNLLLKLGLFDRDIDSPNYEISQEIDYKYVDMNIEKLKKISIKVLKDILFWQENL